MRVINGYLYQRVCHYVSDDLRQREDDVVWRVRFRGNWLYVYLLLEFQSTLDSWMALRMLVYVGLLYQDLVRRKQLTPNGRLPPVLPIVLYNGEARWTAATELFDLIEPVAGNLRHYLPRQRHLVIDEGRIVAGEQAGLRIRSVEPKNGSYVIPKPVRPEPSRRVNGFWNHTQKVNVEKAVHASTLLSRNSFVIAYNQQHTRRWQNKKLPQTVAVACQRLSPFRHRGEYFAQHERLFLRSNCRFQVE